MVVIIPCWLDESEGCAEVGKEQEAVLWIFGGCGGGGWGVGGANLCRISALARMCGLSVFRHFFCCCFFFGFCLCLFV